MMMYHAVNELLLRTIPSLSLSLHLLLRCSSAAACASKHVLHLPPHNLLVPRAPLMSSWSSTTPHRNVLGENPPPYSLQPTTAQRHENMAESGAAGQNQPLKPIDPITKRYDDMHESYGEGYATRSAEEGFGGIYTSPLTVKEGNKTKGASHNRDDDDIAPGMEPVQEFDHTQGSPVAEKERTSRHGGAGFTGST